MAFYLNYEWQCEVELPKVVNAHNELVRFIEASRPRKLPGYDQKMPSYHEEYNQYLDEPQDREEKTNKEVFLELLEELPEEQNIEFLLEELRHVSESLNESIKFKDVSAVVDVILARGHLQSSFHEFLDLFVKKMEASEKDKLLILILSQLGVTEEFNKYSGLKLLFEKTRAKSKCIRYSLNLVTKHYEENSQEKLGWFVKNLFELLFEDHDPSFYSITDLMELIELFIKGLDFHETNLTSERILDRLTSEYSGVEFSREVERLLVNKQADYYRLQEWLDAKEQKQSRGKFTEFNEPDHHTFEQPEENFDHIDFEKKLEELKQRTRLVTSDLKPDYEEDTVPAYHSQPRKEQSYRPSGLSNPEAESLIRLRNNFFADADSLLGDGDHNEGQEYSRRLPSTFTNAEQRQSVNLPPKADHTPRNSSNNGVARQVGNFIPPAQVVQKPAEPAQDNQTWIREKKDLQSEIERLTRELNAAKIASQEKNMKIEMEPKEVLEREIMYYKSSRSLTDRLAAMKRLIKAMVEREADVDEVVSQLDDCAKTNKNTFMSDLRDTLQSLGTSKGIKRSMFEGLLRFAIRTHTKDPQSTDVVNGVINSLVVTQHLELTIDCLVSILAAELPPMETKFSQGSLSSSRRHRPRKDDHQDAFEACGLLRSAPALPELLLNSKGNVLILPETSSEYVECMHL